MTTTVQIDLTQKQKAKLHKATGRNDSSVQVPVCTRTPLAAKAAPRSVWIDSPQRGSNYNTGDGIPVA
jgi:hypothetical protein